jgi:hypothetical protein
MRFSIGDQICLQENQYLILQARELEWEICVDKGTWSSFVFTVSVALSALTTPHRCMQVVGLWDLRESGTVLGFSLDLFIVV